MTEIANRQSSRCRSVPVCVPIWYRKTGKMRLFKVRLKLEHFAEEMQELRPLIGDSHDARVAELVDAHDSGSCPSNGVQVQLLPRAPSTLASRFKHFRQLVQKQQVFIIIKIQRIVPVSVSVWFLSRLLPTKNIPRSKTDVVNLSGGCGSVAAPITHASPLKIQTVSSATVALLWRSLI